MENDRLMRTAMDLPQRVKALQFDKGDAIDAEGRYKFVRKLGSGAMGKVFLFRDVRLNRDRAVKTVEEILTQFPAAVEGLKHECEMMQVLTHPNIVAVRDLVMDQWGYRYYIVMDYADGVTLYEYLSENKKPGKAIVCGIIEKLASALDFAHGMGLLHRDVKTDNVMVTFNGEELGTVKLLDFGIGRKINEILMATTGGSAGGGASAYRSPEGWKPRQYGKVSARSDQYSLAVMAYEMLAGRRPYWEFEADDDVLRGAVVDENEIPERIDGVEDYVNDALLKALSKRQEDRFESCGAFAKALTTAPAAPKPVTVEPPAAPPAPRPVVSEKPSARPPEPAEPPAVEPWPRTAASDSPSQSLFSSVFNWLKSSPPGAGSPSAPRPAAQSVAEGDMTLVLPGNVPLELVHIPHGTFMMGSPESEPERYSGEVQHRVTLTKDYWLGKYPVTQGQWEAVMGSNPSWFKKGGDYPVEEILWNEAMEFCRIVTERERSGGRLAEKYEYTLPTEAQWEYACRAGTTTPFNFGSTLNGDKANCDGKYPYGGAGKGRRLGRTSKVGSYAPNAWGLYDMHGNVWEWCRDWYGDYPTGSVTDPLGPSKGSYRVLHGGSWIDDARYCRSAIRNGRDPANSNYIIGFRVALAPVQ